jgi:O-antigen/teichoic acid export membrane protein
MTLSDSIKGGLWGCLSTAGSRGAAVLASFFLARILGKEGFGEK